ncbi:MAG: 4-hydroxy-tetrahydrodipicolinate reductase [Kiritimatiellia bacterium]|jgi:4-hydroxy-tetrahydrodipicolinate reductase
MSQRITIIGAGGRMGNALVRCLVTEKVPGLRLSGAVDLSTNPGQGQDMGVLSGVAPAGVPLTSDLPALAEQTDIFIDFSFHSGIRERVELIASWNKRVVVGTTGLTETELQSLQELAVKLPIVFAPNMSLGVNLLAALVEQAAARLKGQGYDIEVTEMHHRRKLDAPSGTALFLGEAAARGSQWKLADVAQHGREGITDGDRPDAQIGFHSLRGGDVVGDHSVLFAAEGEMLELSHRATNRDTFAIGALRAAAWLADKGPGLYSMRDVLGLQG